MFLNRKLIIAIMSLSFASFAFADTNSTQASDQIQTTVQSLDTKTTIPTAKVDINKATTDDLMKVKGIDQKRAKNIVAYRTKNGNFKSLTELKDVRGFKKMKEEKLKAIQDQLSIE